MASYQARGRDPLFDSKTQAVLERRGKELIGMVLIAVGAVIALMLGSYVPEDPSWLSVTDAPVQNMLGRMGATIASPLMIVVGLASWGFAVCFAAWGLRFILHVGEERALARAVFAPIAIALVAVFASSYGTSTQGFGGLFGDTALAALVSFLPLGGATSLKLLGVVSLVAAVFSSLFVLGFSRLELSRIGRFLVFGVVSVYAVCLHLMGRTARGSVVAGQKLAAGAAERRETRREARLVAQSQADEYARTHAHMQMAQDAQHDGPAGGAPQVGHVGGRVIRPDHSAMPDAISETISGAMDPMAAEAHHAPYDGAPDASATHTQGLIATQPQAIRPPQKTGLLAGLLKRNAAPSADADIELEPELIEPDFAPEPPLRAGGDQRISDKIASAISARSRPAAPVMGAERVEPPLSAAQRAAARYKKGPEPMILADVDAAQAAPLDMPLAQHPLQHPPHYDDADGGDAMADFAPIDAYDAADFDAGYAPDIDPLETPEYVAPQAERFAPVAPIPAPKKVVKHPAKKPTAPSARAMAEAQPSLKFDPAEAVFEVPPLSLLDSGVTIQRHTLSDEALEENARMLENVLDDYGVKGEIVSVRPGPVVTMYELEPAPGLKASRVIGLADDIARSMSALSARVSTVPGRSVIGIELPNEHRETVNFREILSTRDFGDGKHSLPLALGKDIGGDSVVTNLAKMPHLLIAGTTGSGKSVAINTMILSLLYKLTPEECRLIMIDPKMLELSVYDGIPHLLSPVVTDPKKAVVALKWVVAEMEERYRKMSKMGVRNIDGYNGRVKDALSKGELFSRTVQTGFDEETGDPIFETEEFQPETLPYIVVIVDEMADLMMVAGKEIEACIQRLAQMARASGIHLIMATQRPSVDVITGTIKANFPTRISFQVTSKIDSRTILGEQGAEQLLGMGDMLYMSGGGRITRCHAPFVSDEEVEKVVTYLKAYGPPDYVGGVQDGPESDKEADINAVLGLTGGNSTGEDALYDQAVAIVIKDRKCSTSYIQRKLAIGYNKAARLVEQMEDEGVVSSANHVGKREILVPEQ